MFVGLKVGECLYVGFVPSIFYLAHLMISERCLALEDSKEGDFGMKFNTHIHSPYKIMEAVPLILIIILLILTITIMSPPGKKESKYFSSSSSSSPQTFMQKITNTTSRDPPDGCTSPLWCVVELLPMVLQSCHDLRMAWLQTATSRR